MYETEPRTGVELPTTLASIGVAIKRDTIDLATAPGPGRNVWLKDDGSTVVYVSERNAVFTVSDGREITVDPASVESDDEIQLNLLGPLFRLVHLLCGELVLHGSVVRIGARTVMFIAPSGGGKSTMAAGLYDRGHDVLADDSAIVRPESGPEVLGGPPVLKLHEETAARIDRTLEPVFPDGFESGKRFYHPANGEVSDRRSLDTVYFVEEGDTIEVESVSGRDATVECIHNLWALPDRNREATGSRLRRCSELAGAVTTRRIRYPRSFGVFDDVLSRVEEDCNCGN